MYAGRGGVVCGGCFCCGEWSVTTKRVISSLLVILEVRVHGGRRTAAPSEQPLRMTHYGRSGTPAPRIPRAVRGEIGRRASHRPGVSRRPAAGAVAAGSAPGKPWQARGGD